MFERVINLIGKENFNKIEKQKILLVGVGGVGGFVLEALVRTGFKKITIIDNDVIDKTNLNRQIITTNDVIGKSKVEIAKNRMLKINNKVEITALEMFLDKSNINNLEKDFDYVIDACDTLNTKLELIKYAESNKIKIISSMGLGNRVDASNIEITSLNKTKNDPLAKKLRKLVKENNLNSKIKVVCSKNIPLKKGVVNSLITSPGIGGLLIVDYIINDLLDL